MKSNQPITVDNTDKLISGEDEVNFTDRSQELSHYSRRQVLTTAVAACGGLGLITASYPFLSSLNPSERTKGSGGPVTVDISNLKPGEQRTIQWRGLPVWVLHRDQSVLTALMEGKQIKKLADPQSKVESQQPDYARNAYRSIKPNYSVVIGICTHLGCVPSFRPQPGSTGLGPDWPGGYFCPCHASRFDLAGRVYKNMPAPSNLTIPPHQYIDENTIKIGVHHEQA